MDLDPQSVAAAALVGVGIVAATVSYFGNFISGSSLPKSAKPADSKPKKAKKKSKKKSKKKITEVAEETPKPAKDTKKVKKVEIVEEKPATEPVKVEDETEKPKKKKKRNKKKKKKAVVEESPEDSASSDEEIAAKPSGTKVTAAAQVKTAADIALEKGVDDEDGWSTVPVRGKKNKAGTVNKPVVEVHTSVKNTKTKEIKQVINLGEHVQVVLGEGGNTISNIQNVSGARVAVNKDNRMCTVSGDDESVEVAVQLIKSLISNQAKEIITVDTQLDKAILTKADTRQSIRDLSGAKVDFSFGKNKDDPMSVIVTGESHKVETAKSLIQAYLEGKTPGGEDGVKRVKVTAFQGRILIGQKGSQISSLQKDSGASINVEFVEDENIALVTVIGEPEQIARGMELIQNFLREHNLRTRVELDPNARPGVLLKLNDLRRKIPNLQVDVSDDRSHILLCGSGPGLTEGSTLIQEWIEEELGAPKLLPGQVMEELDLEDAAGKVIGKNKSVLNSILANAKGAEVAIKQGTICYVYGTPAGVAKAYKEIKGIVERHKDLVAKSHLEQEELQGANWVVLGEDEESRLQAKDKKTLIAPESDWGGYRLAQMQGW